MASDRLQQPLELRLRVVGDRHQRQLGPGAPGPRGRRLRLEHALHGVGPAAARGRERKCALDVRARPLAGRAQTLWIAQRLHQGRRRGAGVPGRIQRAGPVADDLERAARGRCHHRAPGGHRLQQHEPERLTVSAVEQARGRRERATRVGQRARKLDPAREVVSGRPATEIVEQQLAGVADGMAGDDEPQLGHLLGGDRHRLERKVGPLPIDYRSEQQRRRRLDDRRSRVEGVGVDTGRDHPQARAEPAVRVEVVGDRARQGDHEVGVARRGPYQPRDAGARQEVDVLEHQRDVAGHRPERRRAGDRAAHPHGDHRPWSQ